MPGASADCLSRSLAILSTFPQEGEVGSGACSWQAAVTAYAMELIGQHCAAPFRSRDAGGEAS